MKVLEIDVHVQTLKHVYDAPLFEGIEAEDCKYHLLYSDNSDTLLIIYPANIIVVYNSQNGELQHTIQALPIYNIVCPVIV